MLKRWLLLCGIFAPLVRVVADVLAAIWYPGYSFWNQTMSQLAAIGAPTRAFQMVLLAVFNVLVTAFGVGVWISAGKKLSLRIAGILIVLFGITGLIALAFPQTAMQLNGGMEAQSVHIIVTAASVLLIILFMGFGAAAYGMGFRLFSAVTVIIMLLFGYMAAAKAPHAVDFAAPGMGTLERICYYSYLLWIAVFAILLLRKKVQKN
jgi:hypothetical protein